MVLPTHRLADQNTEWSDDINRENLAPGTILQVSGVPDDQAVIHAGYIAYPPADAKMGVKGLPHGLDTVRQKVKINDLVVDYSQMQPPPPDTMWPGGRPIAVEGELADETLIAASLDLFLTETFDSADDFSINGFIEASSMPDQWRMHGYDIRFADHTIYTGLLPEDITAGIRLHLRGQLLNGALLVEQAAAAAAVPRVQLEANISQVNLAGQWLTLDGMTALRIHADALTRIQGKAATLEGLHPGDHVRIHASMLDSQSVVATRIFLSVASPQADRFQLQGPVAPIADTVFFILGIMLDSTANTGIEFSDADQQAVTHSVFLNLLSPGITVRVDGKLVNGQIIYEKMTIIG